MSDFRPNWAPGQPEDLPTVEGITLDTFESLPKKYPDRAFIVSATDRPGSSTFCVEVEYTMYEPDTEKNGELGFIITEFPEKSGLRWFTLVVPLVDLEKIKEIAQKYELELKPDFTAVLFDDKGAQKFPIGEGPNIFFLQGGMKDELKLKQLRDHWDDVIEKVQFGIPWKV